MLTRNLTLRIAGPTLFVSLLFLGSCITAAFYLHHRQSASLRALDEDLGAAGWRPTSCRALEALPGDRPADEECPAWADRRLDRPGRGGARISRRRPGSWAAWRTDSTATSGGRRTGRAGGGLGGRGPRGPRHPGGGARPDLPRAGAVQRRGGRALRGRPPAGGHVDGLGVGRGGCHRVARRPADGLWRGPRPGPVRAAGRGAGGGRPARRRHGPRAPQPPDRDQDAGPDQPRGGGGAGPARGGPERHRAGDPPHGGAAERVHRLRPAAEAGAAARRPGGGGGRDARPGRRPGPQAAGDPEVRPARDPGRGRGRRRAGPAIAGQPRPECAGRHAAGRHPGDRAASARATITPSWRSSTPGRASRRGTCPGSTSRSSPARRRGSGWAWPSPSGSPATTAAASGRRTGRRAGPASSSGCPRREGRARQSLRRPTWRPSW